MYLQDTGSGACRRVRVRADNGAASGEIEDNENCTFGPCHYMTDTTADIPEAFVRWCGRMSVSGHLGVRWTQSDFTLSGLSLTSTKKEIAHLP